MRTLPIAVLCLYLAVTQAFNQKPLFSQVNSLSLEGPVDPTEDLVLFDIPAGGSIEIVPAEDYVDIEVATSDEASEEEAPEELAQVGTYERWRVSELIDDRVALETYEGKFLSAPEDPSDQITYVDSL